VLNPIGALGAIMLFNSVPFLFLFLPLVLLVFFAVGRISHRLAAAWLAATSLFFYGWWDPLYVGLLLASIAFNYLVGYRLAQWSSGEPKRLKALLTFGVLVDLGLLAYFKYANFFVNSVNATLDTSFELAQILLPLGISFFTFTQIAFLVDAARGHAKEFSLIHYGLFVTYFPHLIAGPVLHHGEMMPQFRQASTYRFNAEFMTVGFTFFALGLFKKVVLADGVAPFAAPVFAAAQAGTAQGFFQAWSGALAYSLQLYFDFSGYCDMAIGISYMIGVKLPINFNSPYKAQNISEFWRRWHMTLSRFLRDYLYIPLGGNKRGPSRRYINLMTTMLLGGLWHGAGWTFVIWGGLHGLYLAAHHAWQSFRSRQGHTATQSTRWGRFWAVSLTFFCVVIAWVFFRATSVQSAVLLIQGMFGFSGVSLPSTLAPALGPLAETLGAWGVSFTPGGGREFVMAYVWIALLLPVVFFGPNTQDIMHLWRPSLGPSQAPRYPWLLWQPNRTWAWIMTVVLGAGLLSLTRPSEFLYFQF
jgi:alginate O-acetyltransferase complex protein AlgI